MFNSISMCSMNATPQYQCTASTVIQTTNNDVYTQFYTYLMCMSSSKVCMMTSDFPVARVTVLWWLYISPYPSISTYLGLTVGRTLQTLESSSVVWTVSVVSIDTVGVDLCSALGQIYSLELSIVCGDHTVKVSYRGVIALPLPPKMLIHKEFRLPPFIDTKQKSCMTPDYRITSILHVSTILKKGVHPKGTLTFCVSFSCQFSASP